jgi:hypothetical protein
MTHYGMSELMRSRRREDGYHVAASQAVQWEAHATQRGISTKEGFLYLALMVVDEGEARFPFVFTPDLFTSARVIRHDVIAKL